MINFKSMKPTTLEEFESSVVSRNEADTLYNNEYISKIINTGHDDLYDCDKWEIHIDSEIVNIYVDEEL